ncbi:MAG: cache domain-containing protein, partial [Methanosarcinales archaeon]|nr:cache domain-containing protein [Methanosarcinales archaeon]
MSHKKLTILTIAALLIVVVVCLGYATNREVEKIVRQQSNEQQILLTRQSAAGIEAFLDEKTVLIEVLATEVVNVPPENMTPYFMTVYNKSSGFSSIGFVNSDGVIVTGYPPEDAAIGLDLYATKRNAQFDRARESKETYTTRPVPLVQGGVGSNVGVPIYSGGEFKGVIFAVIEISTLSTRFLADTVSKGHGHTYMITRSGRCLYDG